MSFNHTLVCLLCGKVIHASHAGTIDETDASKVRGNRKEMITSHFSSNLILLHAFVRFLTMQELINDQRTYYFLLIMAC